MKNIWIMNHYATDNYYNLGGRHYWFAKYFKNKGYNVTIFCANTRHNSTDKINVSKNKYVERVINGITFVFVKSHSYSSNNHHRILNMITFSKRLVKVSEEYRKRYGQPDVILASSVHPLTLLAGLKVAKKWSVRCLVEIRDLWPESIVAYGIMKESNPLVKWMYQVEKKIYQKADSIIMTWPGGYEYIKDKKWVNTIPEDKVTYISNGIILEDFLKNAQLFNLDDKDLLTDEYKVFVYTGSIRKVNNLSILVDVANIIEKNYSNEKIKILIYGDGDEKTKLLEKVEKLKINNIIFKDKVHKKLIPFILQNSYGNILHNSSTRLDKYGQSQNKLFEYLAAGKPIVQTYRTGYSVIEENNCGICVHKQEPEEIAKAIVNLAQDEKLALQQGENASIIAKQYDFELLTNKLINLIEGE